MFSNYIGCRIYNTWVYKVMKILEASIFVEILELVSMHEYLQKQAQMTYWKGCISCKHLSIWVIYAFGATLA